MPEERKRRKGREEEQQKKQEQEQREDTHRGGPPADGDDKDPDFDEVAASPEAKFTILVSSLATQVLVNLGQIENPLSKKKEVDLKGAKFSIDLLQMLSDKTKGNLADAERRYLDSVLHQLRMGYVQASK